ncbi:DNA alkylation repair protein [Sphingobacterium faecale]|uniref:DNA alkylation repair protein n=1 Tax=Sphingobacterium faecale TaxID=2803775 RepID=A0ABS1QYI4_9SPHI|nr:DNA alkylation repair protein [Sphingobacterium faecale]MBL1407487.1 DNA alkylation repair protein [Sphingobacterium faecale]
MRESKRKGARSTKDIPVEIQKQLDRGEIETANLVEWLAVDQRLLLENLLIENNRTAYLASILSKINDLEKKTVNTINEVIGITIFKQVVAHNDYEFLKVLTNHKADLIRCWATYTIGQDERLSIAESLSRIQPFAADLHFGVREICWMALRNKITQNLAESIDILSEWATSDDNNIRRFATESIRPRGVWCRHINELKEKPQLALPILERLKSDSARYVQDSVGNWLNDASKSQPLFVEELCKRWANESTTKETAYIIKKALRTINK